jgi:hypothetical protein
MRFRRLYPRIAPRRRGIGYDTIMSVIGSTFDDFPGLSRHTILSVRVRVPSPHTCNPLAMGVVSVCLACTNIIVSSLAAFTIYPLQSGQSYGRPTGDNSTNLCMCSTVVYSLMSACDACQGETWIPCVPSYHLKAPDYVSDIRWSQWVGYCFEILPPST